jgi:hypothetical protein
MYLLAVHERKHMGIYQHAACLDNNFVYFGFSDEVL